MSGDIRLGLQLLPGRRFRVILEGSDDDLDALETDIFQPAIADQIANALEAKVAEQKKKETEQ